MPGDQIPVWEDGVRRRKGHLSSHGTDAFSTSFCHHSEPLEFLGGWSYQKEKASPQSLALGYGFPLMAFSNPGLSLSQKPKDRRCSLSTWKTLRSESSPCEEHAALPCS